MDYTNYKPPSDRENTEPTLFKLSKSLDARLVPEQAGFNAPEGALAISSVEVKLNQANENTHTFPVTPPSSGCVIQKAPEYRMSGWVNFEAGGFSKITGSTQPTPITTGVSYVGQVPTGVLFPRLGVDFAIAAPNPLNSMVQNWQCNINNASSQYNNTGIRDIQQMLTTAAKRAGRGVTYKQPLFARWDDAFGTTNSLGSVSDLQGDGDVPPGAYEVAFCAPANATNWFQFANNTWSRIGRPAQYTLLSAIAATYPLATALAYDTTDWVAGPNPILPSLVPSFTSVGFTTILSSTIKNVGVGGNGAIGLPYLLNNTYVATAADQQNGYIYPDRRLYALRFVVIDTVQCPPFGFDQELSYEEQGLWGVTSMLFTAQLGTPGTARWLQGTRRGGLSALNYLSWKCETASLWFQYLSPAQTSASLLPPRCTLPLMYKQNTTFDSQDIVLPGQDKSISVPSYTFSQVSDVLLISVRPQNNVDWRPDASDSDKTMGVPFYETDVVAAFPDLAFPQFQYCNMTAILTNLSAQQLVAMSRKNGVEASVSQFGGIAGSGQMMSGGVQVSMAGAVCAIRPGIDFPLPAGVTPGAMGNVQIQYTIRVLNQCDRPVKYTVSTTSLSSGFFVMDNGAARLTLVGILPAALSTADKGMDHFAVTKLCGGGFLSTLGSWAGKAWKHRKAIAEFAGNAKNVYDKVTGDDAPTGSSMGVAGSSMGIAGAGGMKRSRGSLMAALDR